MLSKNPRSRVTVRSDFCTSFCLTKESPEDNVSDASIQLVQMEMNFQKSFLGEVKEENQLCQENFDFWLMELYTYHFSDNQVSERFYMLKYYFQIGCY